MIDLRSDTVTRPDSGMRQAMAEAAVGDDVFGEDPTVRALQERVAELLGKEAALFVPSGVMANQIGVLVHTQPGTEVILERKAHIFNYEGASPAWLSSVQLCPIEGKQGVLAPEDVSRSIRKGIYGQPATSLICLENTHNLAGGKAQTVQELKAITDIASAHQIPTHLDGARLWNASIATSTPVGDYGALFDTISVCLSKGLGAPIGSLLVGNASTIAHAHKYRKRLGGGMRQVGILAAAGLYALDHHLERLEDDHEKAVKLGRALADLPCFSLSPAHIETNIVYFDVKEGIDVQNVLRILKEQQVLMVPMGPQTIRAVTHLDVSMRDIEQVIEIVQASFRSHSFAT